MPDQRLDETNRMARIRSAFEQLKARQQEKTTIFYEAATSLYSNTLSNSSTNSGVSITSRESTITNALWSSGTQGSIPVTLIPYEPGSSPVPLGRVEASRENQLRLGGRLLAVECGIIENDRFVSIQKFCNDNSIDLTPIVERVPPPSTDNREDPTLITITIKVAPSETTLLVPTLPFHSISSLSFLDEDSWYTPKIPGEVVYPGPVGVIIEIPTNRHSCELIRYHIKPSEELERGFESCIEKIAKAQASSM